MKSYKYVGVNTCYPMSILVSRLTAVGMLCFCEWSNFCQIIFSVVTPVNAKCWNHFVIIQTVKVSLQFEVNINSL